MSSVLRDLMIRKMTSSLSSSDFPEPWTLLLLGPLLLQGLCEEKNPSQKRLNKKKKEGSTHSVRYSLCTVVDYLRARGPTQITQLADIINILHNIFKKCGSIELGCLERDFDACREVFSVNVALSME